MAAIAVSSRLGGNAQVMKFTWTLTTADPNGDPIPNSFCEFADRTVYFLGGATWGGATAAWQGGDGSVWLTLTDAQTVAITKTVDGIETVIEVPEFSRPALTAVGAAASIVVTCIARRNFRRGG